MSGTLPREWQERVLHMMDGWTEPWQVLPGDLDRWIAVLEDARDAVQHEIVIEPSPTVRALLEPGLASAMYATLDPQD